ACWEAEGFRVSFKKRHETPPISVSPSMEGLAAVHETVEEEPETLVEEAPPGSPVASPMNGIFYTSPSPNAAPFVKEGDAVASGQVVGLIEAMKVFNEITTNFSGVV